MGLPRRLMGPRGQELFDDSAFCFRVVGTRRHLAPALQPHDHHAVAVIVHSLEIGALASPMRSATPGSSAAGTEFPKIGAM